jgi:hypothetical protein
MRAGIVAGTMQRVKAVNSSVFSSIAIFFVNHDLSLHRGFAPISGAVIIGGRQSELSSDSCSSSALYVR